MPLAVERWPVPSAAAIEAHAKNDVGFFEATLDSRIQLHMERQQRAMSILRWLPWALFGAASLLAIVLGWRWQRWSSTEHRRLIAMLLGLAIAIPFTATLIELYPLFFVLDRPRAEHIAQALSGALNCFAFAVLLDGAIVLLFLISRALRR